MGQTRLFIGRNQAMGAEKKRGLIGRLWHGLFVIVTSYLALVGLLVTVLSILFAVFLAKAIKQQDNGSSPKSVLNSSPPINNSFLRIKIDRPVIARRLDEKEKFLSQIFSDTLPISLQDLETALLRASDDARVHGVMLELSNGSADFSTVTALRRALGQFSESKKPIYASLDEGDTLHYYLASVGNKISLSPLGGLNITGPAFQLTYFGSALEKLGIQLEVLRAGKFKSAMESFIQDQPSAETLEMYQALEKSLRGTVATAIATSRKHSESEVDKWLKQSFFTSSEALKAGLVDRVGYLPEWEDEVKTEQKLDSIVDMKAYLHDTAAKGEARLAKSKEAIGLIEAEGEIGMGASNTRNSIDPEHIIEELHWAAEQDEIKAVVLRVNSPGGSALASDLIWNEVRKLAAKKPLVVSMGAVAASGGYYISAPAALILAEPTSITGSIGVIGAIPKGLKFAEKWGVNFHMVTASDRKDYLNFGTKSSEEDKNLLRASIKSTYDIFVQKVAEGRKLKIDRVYEIAEGRVYTGAEALSLGLVDRLGGLTDAVHAAKELAKLEISKSYPLEFYHPQPKSLLECIQGGDWLECMAEPLDKESLLRLSQPRLPFDLDHLQNLQKQLESGKALAFWPGLVRWKTGFGSAQED